MASWTERVCLSRVTGDGLTPETAFRAKITEYPGVTARCLIKPGMEWALAICSVEDDRAILEDTDIILLPETLFDARLTREKQRFISEVVQETLGLDPILATTMRGYIGQIAKAIDRKVSGSDF